MAPKVLVSDKLSETAVQIFRDRGIDVDFMPDLGKDKDKLALAIVVEHGGHGGSAAAPIAREMIVQYLGKKEVAAK